MSQPALRNTIVVLVCLAMLVTSSHALAQLVSQRKRAAAVEIDLLDVALLPTDHKTAAAVLSEYDEDQDGFLDTQEMKELQWEQDPEFFDINRNGRLTALEITIRFANLRKHYHVIVRDTYNAERLINTYDVDGDRMLAEEELESFPWVFKLPELDLNKDNQLAVMELAKRFASDREEHGIEALDQYNAFNLVRKLDEDGDHKLNRAEIKAATLPVESPTFDTNKDGKLTTYELASGFARFNQEHGIDFQDQNNARRFISRYDRDADGTLNEEEIKDGGWPKNSKQYDANQDDRITAYELMAGFAKNRGKAGVEEQDRQAAKRLITRYDRNKNLVVDLAELLDERAGVGVLDSDSFIQFDADGDNRMTRMEVATYLANQRKEKRSD